MPIRMLKKLSKDFVLVVLTTVVLVVLVKVKNLVLNFIRNF